LPSKMSGKNGYTSQAFCASQAASNIYGHSKMINSLIMPQL
jgi:hypothetical protein